VQLSPTSLTFANQNLNTTSAAQTVTLSNNGPTPLGISIIATSGDFAQANNCGTSLIAGGNCTISVTFTPITAGTRSGALTITDNAVAGSTQTVPLSGTGVGPTANLPSFSRTFSDQMLGTTSAARTVTLINAGNAPLAISSITASGDFSQTNDCSASLAASSYCTMNVTFKPSAIGARTGTLTITDDSNNAPGSTQTVSLSGTGQDFTMAIASGSTATAHVAPGQSATYTLSVAGQGGFSQSVIFACSGVPSGATCAISPSTLTLGSSAANVTVTVTTTAPSIGGPRSRPLSPVLPLTPSQESLLALALALTAMAWAVGRWNRPGASKWRSVIVPLASALLLTLALAGCGGGDSAHAAGTPAGTYTLRVTGSAESGSSTLSHSVTLTLNVS
jgi:hypothetical protein